VFVIEPVMRVESVIKIEPAPIVYVIIPALNEQESIRSVVDSVVGLIAEHLVHRIIVADNASTDQTASVARDAGASVVVEPRRGYGSACLRAMHWIDALPRDQQPDIVVFMDGDGSDDPMEIVKLLVPIVGHRSDFVVGSRRRLALPGSMTFPQRSGNRLACWLIRLIWRHRYTDLGPFRAIRWESLRRLDMRDRDFGWTVEMQIKALQHRLRIEEIDVVYRKRLAGRSKISGTIRGVVLAGTKILLVIFRSIRATRRHEA
jgi:glycosyltransferase involved in cell wall biosynthesis